jgi:RimJ/RimL family protein N-acetyltransferase
MITIRTVRESDAAALLALRLALDEETPFMMLEAGERTTSVEDTRSAIRAVLARDHAIILVAEDGEQLVGLVTASGGEFRRNRATAYVVAGVRQGWAGQGVGRQLFVALDGWARGAGIHRLELTVMTHNERAIALYRRMGFEIEGTKRETLRVGGRWVDEYEMAKLYPEETE